MRRLPFRALLKVLGGAMLYLGVLQGCPAPFVSCTLGAFLLVLGVD